MNTDPFEPPDDNAGEREPVEDDEPSPAEYAARFDVNGRPKHVPRSRTADAAVQAMIREMYAPNTRAVAVALGYWSRCEAFVDGYRRGRRRHGYKRFPSRRSRRPRRLIVPRHPLTDELDYAF